MHVWWSAIGSLDFGTLEIWKWTGGLLADFGFPTFSVFSFFALAGP
jgi:hypothetical protein